jgi:hypothetical protein
MHVQGTGVNGRRGVWRTVVMNFRKPMAENCGEGNLPFESFRVWKWG